MQPINPQTNRVSTTLRLTGLWMIWVAWCQLCGWGLSAIHQLSGWGYLASLPILFFASWLWLKATNNSTATPKFSSWQKWRRRFSRSLPLIFLLIAVLSLVAGVSTLPWSSDGINYRLPRILYWWTEHRWYWIGTLDHRLDYSSIGFEWQMLPVILFTRTDQFIFLLSWLPFLLMPGLTFAAFRTLGISGRGARLWMWLLPSGFCYALQSSGLQNDGCMVGYTLGAIIFCGLAWRGRQILFFWMALLSVALLVGAKLSNLPLLLPMALLLWPVLTRVKWLNAKTALIVLLAVGVSFLPLAVLCWKHTGDWRGDPDDQWNVRPRSTVGVVIANSIALVDDLIQPPVFPLAKKLDAKLKPINDTHFMQWLRWAHPNSGGITFGEVAYEGDCGLGSGLGLYLLFLMCGIWFIRPPPQIFPGNLPWAWRVAPWATWISFAVIVAKIAFIAVTRYGASFYPLMFIALAKLPRVAALERRKAAGFIAGAAMLAVVPVIFLTPTRPLFPIQTLARVAHVHALEKLAEQYHFWDYLRDELAPLRAQLPPDATRIGFAGAFLDAPYGLFKPPGSRKIIELGLPLGSGKMPEPDLKYAVVTERGVQQRYQCDLKTWLARAGGEIIFTYPRNVMLDAHSPPKYESWYLVKLNPPINQPDVHGTAH